MEHKRKCIVCGELRPQNNLLRITKEHDSGNIVLQPNSKIFGRSAYLCYNQSCINMALKKNKLNRALKTKANLADILKGQLDGQFKS